MGVYHLMGLGRSPGAVTGPLSYLAHRYQRWNDDDRRFFARSGELSQRRREEKVGDVEVLVLFTTREVLAGKDEKGSTFLSYRYTQNPAGRVAGNERPEEPIRELLRHLLKQEWPAVSGGRRTGALFWCEVDRRDIRITYERVIRVVAALAGVGGQGKEIWINLTGGNNVVNFALELAATLSGNVARLYYVQAENPQAEKCVRFTAENGYWVHLPVLPLALGHLSQAIIDLLVDHGPISLTDLYSTLRNKYWDLSRGVTSEKTLRDEYLAPLWKQGLTAGTEAGYVVGSQWELVRPYDELLRHAQQNYMTLGQLVQQQTWIQQEELEFHL
jgi:hypothetical protein